MFKKYIQKWLRDLVFEHSWLLTMTSRISFNQKEKLLRDLCSRVSIDTMREMLDEAEQSGEKRTTLARLLEHNYNKVEKSREFIERMKPGDTLTLTGEGEFVLQKL